MTFPGYILVNYKTFKTKTLVVLKDTRFTVNATCFSMVAKRNSLAFVLYPTFVILTTDMDIIPKTKVIIVLLDL